MPTRPRSGTDRERVVDEGYAAHAGELLGFATRSLGDRGLAEEAVQETFVRAWRAADRFDRERGSLRTWLFAIARNVVIDLARQRASRPPLAAAAPDADGGEDWLDRALLGWQVEEALRRLSDAHREVLIATYFAGRPYAELARELGVAPGTIKSRVYYALRALRDVLEEMGRDA